jgi:hypothetical protein
MIEKSQKIVDAFDQRYETIGPFDEDWQELCIAATLRELVKQYAYNNFHIDGDHGIDVINVKDIMKVIEKLDK